jgi:hypothetical protein
MNRIKRCGALYGLSSHFFFKIIFHKIQIRVNWILRVKKKINEKRDEGQDRNQGRYNIQVELWFQNM